MINHEGSHRGGNICLSILGVTTHLDKDTKVMRLSVDINDITCIRCYCNILVASIRIVSQSVVSLINSHIVHLTPKDRATSQPPLA